MNTYTARAMEVGQRIDLPVYDNLLIDLITMSTNRFVIHYGEPAYPEFTYYNPFNPQLSPSNKLIIYVPTWK